MIVGDRVKIKPGTVLGSKYFDGREGVIDVQTESGETVLVLVTLKSGRTVRWAGDVSNLEKLN